MSLLIGFHFANRLGSGGDTEDSTTPRAFRASRQRNVDRLVAVGVIRQSRRDFLMPRALRKSINR